jgi:Lrp/AsnC family leucine-responsive transcriptional regulator
VQRDRRQREGGHDPDLGLVAGQGRARSPAGHGGDRGEREVGRRDAHPGRHARPRSGDHGRLDQQQAHGADLHRDRQPGDQPGEESGGGVHAPVLPSRTARCKALPRTTAKIAAMDQIDSEILRLLREDARLSWRDLGAAVGLSSNAAADRVRRLRRAGVITGFVALVDPAAGGRTMQALVGVHLAPGTDSDVFAEGAARLEPVTEVLHLTGAPDYQLRVACRDTAELDALLRVLRLRHGVADTETTIILRSGPPHPAPSPRQP